MKGKKLSAVIGGICLIVVLTVSLAACAKAPTPAPTPTPAEPEFVWKLQTAWAAGNKINECAKHGFDLIELYSNGRIEIDMYTAGEIVPSFEVWEAVGKGVIDAGHACNCYTIGKCYAGAWFCAAPGGPRDIEKLAWMYDGGGLEILNEWMGKYYNVVAFPTLLMPEVFLYSRERIDSWADLKAMKIRSAGARAEVFKEAGVTVVTLPGGEIVPSQEKGVIDACEYASIFCDLGEGFGSVSKYIYFGRAPLDGQNMIMINKTRWDELPPDLKEAVQRANRENFVWSIGEIWYRDMMACREAEDEYGIKVLPLPDDVQAELDAATERLIEKKVKEDPEFKRIMDSWHKFLIEEGYAEFGETVRGSR